MSSESNSESFLQKLKENWIVSAIITALVGLVLVLFPEEILKVFGYAVGCIAVILGVVRTVRYFREDHTYPFLLQSDLLMGLLSTGFGLFMIVSPDKVISMLPFVFGVLFIGCGIGGVLRARDAKKAGLSSSTVLMILALVSVAFGVVCMINPFGVMKTTVIVIGAALVYEGLTDLITTLTVSRRIKKWKESQGSAES